jgi:hypothetical protein
VRSSRFGWNKISLEIDTLTVRVIDVSVRGFGIGMRENTLISRLWIHVSPASVSGITPGVDADRLAGSIAQVQGGDEVYRIQEFRSRSSGCGGRTEDTDLGDEAPNLRKFCRAAFRLSSFAPPA